MTKIKNLLRSTIVILGSLIVLTAGLVFYIHQLRSTLNDELTAYLTEVANQSVRTVKTQLTGDMNSLKSAAVILSQYDEFDNREISPLLVREAKANNFKRMGFVSPRGVAFLSDGFLLDVSEKSYFQRAIAGEPNASDRFADAIDGKDIVVMAVPIRDGENIKGVLFSSNSLEFYSDILAVKSFGGEGFSLIIKASGEKVVASRNSQADPGYSNIFDHPANATLDPDHSMRRDMAAGKAGIRLYERTGRGNLFMNYVPVGVNDWFLLSVVPAEHVSRKTHNLLWLSLILCMTGVVVFSALLFYIMMLHKESRLDLYNIAYTDSITGFDNWTKSQEEIQKLEHKNSDEHYAFVVFDVNKFKIINELHGYTKGNMLLAHIANVLKDSLRPGEIFSRISGDIFQMLLHFEQEEEIRKRLEMINEKIIHFQAQDKQHYQLILSFGVYFIQDLKMSPATMLNRALIAHKTIKGQYQDIVAFYDDAVRTQITQEKQIENDMEEALQKHQFVIRFEPIYNIQTNQIVYAKSHVFWNHPQKGLLDSSQFIHIFEKNGFIARLDRFIAAEVCSVLAKMKKEGLNPPPVAITLSYTSIRNEYLPEMLQQLLNKNKLSPSTMLLGLWEDSEFQKLSIAYHAAQKLHAMGFKLLINGFAASASALKRLRDLPVDLLTIEPDFVEQIPADERTCQILFMLADLAHQLGIRLVFENVKTQEQIDFIKQIHCELAQGPLLCAPLTLEQLMEKLESAKKRS